MIKYLVPAAPYYTHLRRRLQIFLATSSSFASRKQLWLQQASVTNITKTTNYTSATCNKPNVQISLQAAVEMNICPNNHNNQIFSNCLLSKRLDCKVDELG